MVVGCHLGEPQLVEALPLPAVLPDPLQEIRDGIFGQGSARVIPADKCAPVMGGHPVCGDPGFYHFQIRHGHDGIRLTSIKNIKEIGKQVSGDGPDKCRSPIGKHVCASRCCRAAGWYIAVVDDMADDPAVARLGVSARHIF